MNSVTNLDDRVEQRFLSKWGNDVLSDNLFDRSSSADPLVERDNSPGLNNGNFATPL